MNFVSKGPIYNTPALGQMMARRRWGDKPSSEPMMVSLLKHICVHEVSFVEFYSDFGPVYLSHILQGYDCVSIPS